MNSADDEIVAVLSQFAGTYTAELRAKMMSRIDGIIGDRHWLSVGSYKESILAEHLANRLPKRLAVGNGFVMAVDHASGTQLTSRQIDVLVWDAAGHAPIFRDGKFVSLSAEGSIGALCARPPAAHVGRRRGVGADSATRQQFQASHSLGRNTRDDI